jgi:uncharacterized protein (DUF488 family)
MAENTLVLYTIGYAGHTIDSFIQALRAQRISVLLDVRLTPISRKKGFSKHALHNALDGAGITYHHFSALGSPKKLRQDLYADGDYEAFFASFRDYLRCHEKTVFRAAELAEAGKVCLMCVEKHPDECHRSVVADAIVGALGDEIAVHHLPAPISTSVRTSTAV